jgi:DNA-binding PadR family transcriptional regulator
MNIPQFVVLGALEQIGHGSGYDVLQDLNRKMIDRWIDIKTGSIYHAIKHLHKTGAIREVEQTRTGGFPTKTIYAPTDAGRAHFDSLQEEAFLGLFPQFYGFKLALKFNTRRSAAEIIHFAELAIARIDGQLTAMDRYLRSLDAASPQYAYDAFFIEHDRRLYAAEKAWIQEVVARIDAVRVGPQVAPPPPKDY